MPLNLIGYIQNWVDSSTTLLLDWFYVDVYNICPVKISKLDESDCQLTDSKLLSTPPTLTKTNSEVIECINSYLSHSNEWYRKRSTIFLCTLLYHELMVYIVEPDFYYPVALI